MARWPRSETFRQDGLLIRRTMTGYVVASSTMDGHWYDMGDGTRCECPGFFYRQTCKHVNAVQKIIRRSPLIGPLIKAKEEARQERQRVV